MTRLMVGTSVRAITAPDQKFPSPYAGRTGVIVAIHDPSVRRRRYDVALVDGPSPWYCFASDEIAPNEAA